MKKLWQKLGVIAFWLTWPGLWLYLRNTHRTRALIVCGDEFLGLKSWLGSSDYILPGGGLHKGENPLPGMLREVREETGLEIKQNDAEFLYKTPAHNKGIPFVYSAFAVRLIKKPTVRLKGLEIIDYVWLSLDSPPTNLAPDVRDILAHWQNKR